MQKMEPPKGLEKTGKEGLPGSEVRDSSCEEDHLSRGLNKGWNKEEALES